MRTAIVTLSCLFGMFALTAPLSAETFVIPVPGLVGNYGGFGGFPLIPDETASVDAGVKFQSISQVHLLLTGTVQPAVYRWFNEMGGGYEMVTVPSNMLASMAGEPCQAAKKVSGGSVFNLTLQLQAGATYDFLLDGQDQVSLSIWSEPMMFAGGAALAVMPSASIATASLEITGVPVPGTLKADVTGDGAVDVVDLLQMAGSWGKTSGEEGFDPACDFNGDATVDVVDLLELARMWNNPR